MKEKVRWKRVSFAIGVGVIAILGATTAYANWKWRQGICVNLNPDGSEEIRYGEDCGKPFESITPATSGENI